MARVRTKNSGQIKSVIPVKRGTLVRTKNYAKIISVMLSDLTCWTYSINTNGFLECSKIDTEPIVNKNDSLIPPHRC